MDINLTFETSTTSVGLFSIDPGFVEKYFLDEALDLTADLCTALFLHAIMLLKQEIKSLGSAKWMQSRQDSFVVTWDHFLNREHT